MDENQTVGRQQRPIHKCLIVLYIFFLQTNLLWQTVKRKVRLLNSQIDIIPNYFLPLPTILFFFKLVSTIVQVGCIKFQMVLIWIRIVNVCIKYIRVSWTYTPILREQRKDQDLVIRCVLLNGLSPRTRVHSRKIGCVRHPSQKVLTVDSPKNLVPETSEVTQFFVLPLLHNKVCPSGVDLTGCN